MIIRLSQQMMKKAGLTAGKINTIEAPDANPLCDWAVHLYRHQRIQYVLATNTSSLFSVTFYGRGITNEATLLNQLFVALREAHHAAGLGEAFERFIAPDGQAVRWSKVGNRAVTGSMNEMIFHAKGVLDESALDPAELGRELNTNILSYIEYRRPLEAHHAMASLKMEQLA